MLHGQPPHDKPKSRPHLTQRQAAKILGVTHWYLNRVLNGRRTSIRLMRRYRELEQKMEVAP